MPSTSKELIDVYGDESEHVVEMNLQGCSKCENCEHFQDKVDKIMTMLNEIQAEQTKDKTEARKCAKESDTKIDMLIDDKNKMAVENETLRSTLAGLVNENVIIQRFLGLKQNEWTDVEAMKSASTSRNEVSAKPVPLYKPQTQIVSRALMTKLAQAAKGIRRFSCACRGEKRNQYRLSNKMTIEINKSENMIRITNNGNQNPTRGTVISFLYVCMVNTIYLFSSMETPRKFIIAIINLRGVSTKLNKYKRNSITRNIRNQHDVKKTLVIGDSMVKHIDGNKIARAGKRKAICHSYSGETVGQIQNKIQKYWAEESQGYDTVILHVGTDDLVHRECQQVAEEMEKFITDVKVHADKVAASGVIKRYDGKIRASKI